MQCSSANIESTKKSWNHTSTSGGGLWPPKLKWRMRMPSNMHYLVEAQQCEVYLDNILGETPLFAIAHLYHSLAMSLPTVKNLNKLPVFDPNLLLSSDFKANVEEEDKQVQSEPYVCSPVETRTLRDFLLDQSCDGALSSCRDNKTTSCTPPCLRHAYIQLMSTKEKKKKKNDDNDTDMRHVQDIQPSSFQVDEAMSKKAVNIVEEIGGNQEAFEMLWQLREPFFAPH